MRLGENYIREASENYYRSGKTCFVDGKLFAFMEKLLPMFRKLSSFGGILFWGDTLLLFVEQLVSLMENYFRLWVQLFSWAGKPVPLKETSYCGTTAFVMRKLVLLEGNILSLRELIFSFIVKLYSLMKQYFCIGKTTLIKGIIFSLCSKIPFVEGKQ